MVINVEDYAVIRNVEYILTEKEYEELKYKLELLENSVRKERERLYNKDKSESEIISYNTADYNISLIYEIKRLAL